MVARKKKVLGEIKEKIMTVEIKNLDGKTLFTHVGVSLEGANLQGAYLEGAYLEGRTF